MSTTRILYGSHTSPPVRAVKLTLAALGVDYEFIFVDTYAGETRTPEFLQKNPQHSVPVLEEADGICLWDSHAIMAYLVRRYGKEDDLLYPKDFYARAVVDQRLHYENGNIFMGLIKQLVGPFMKGQVPKDKLPEILKGIAEIYEMLETFMADNEYIAGKTLTIADFSIVSTVSTIALFAPIESEKYPKLAAWFERMKKLPYYESCNAEGLKIAKERVQAQLAKLA